MYRKSFYQFLMTERNPNSSDEVAQFANNAFYDQAFPNRLMIMKRFHNIWS